MGIIYTQLLSCIMHIATCRCVSKCFEQHTVVIAYRAWLFAKV
jgi:hypothetical protein